MNFKLIIDSKFSIAETPIWDGRIGKLYWTDLFSGDVHRYDPETGKDEKWVTGGIIGSAIPCEDTGKILVNIETGAYLLDLATGEMTLVVDPENGNEKNRYNDSRCDARGRLFMSSVAKTYGTDDYTPDQVGAFYMIDTDKSVKKIVDGIQQYNAMVWTADNKTMLVVDTYHEQLLAFDYDLDKGPVSGPRTVLDFKGGLGMPDGISIDVEDNIYICHWSGVISVWDKNFNHVEDVKFPVEQIACGGFGGKDMKTFFVASAAYCYTEEDMAKNPGAGGMFAAESKIKGTSDHFCRW